MEGQDSVCAIRQGHRGEAGGRRLEKGQERHRKTKGRISAVLTQPLCSSPEDRSVSGSHPGCTLESGPVTSDFVEMTPRHWLGFVTSAPGGSNVGPALRTSNGGKCEGKETSQGLPRQRWR